MFTSIFLFQPLCFCLHSKNIRFLHAAGSVTIGCAAFSDATAMTSLFAGKCFEPTAQVVVSFQINRDITITAQPQCWR